MPFRLAVASAFTAAEGGWRRGGAGRPPSAGLEMRSREATYSLGARLANSLCGRSCCPQVASQRFDAACSSAMLSRSDVERAKRNLFAGTATDR